VIEIRRASEVDAEALLEFIVEAWGAETVAGHEEVMYPARHAGFVALRDGEIVGHVTYRGEGDRCEITTIQAIPRQDGVGTMLMDAVLQAAREEGYRVAWLTTTNDNLDAMRFYQRRGFRFVAVRPGAVDRARELKPEIPEVGMYGIRMSDELDLARELP
jgi:N-acetylglutamate synthase-like GNAT family acetyltransferase